MPSPTTRSATETGKFYDERYSGAYMDTDAYSVWGHGDLRTRQVMDAFAAADIRPARILDYGCGVGGWIGFLSLAFPGAEISGVDISSTAIGKAKQRYPDCRLATFDGLAAPFGDEEFDLVFSYHVLEHVADLDASIADIARVLKPGGYAVIIFPCGNNGSFLDRAMRLVQNAWLPTAEGRTVLFFETDDGHMRRMTSQDTVSIFQANGLRPISQLFSGHFFGTVDWLCRGTGPAYINKVFSGRPPLGHSAAIRLALARRVLLAIHRLISKKSLDLSRKRNPVKQVAVRLAKNGGALADRMLAGLSSLEWRLLKHNPCGTAQYLVLLKGGASPR
jgi:ubiquinone/menaquinone biosynthesis C-methylase UbiE